MTRADVLAMLVVYERPRDYPRHVVVRKQAVVLGAGRIEAAPVACLYDSLDEAMAECESFGLHFLSRHPDDDPNIVGVWL